MLADATLSILGPANGRRLFEIGFGDGAIAHALHNAGFIVSGIDSSTTGVALARQRFPHLSGLDVGDIYSYQPAHNTFPVVLALDVIEHLYSPRRLIDLAFRLLTPGGLFVCSTPYHGYFKNLAVALSGKFDQHVDALWDHGHIKFFSPTTLTKILRERGFDVERIVRIGRIAPVAKNMIALARRPTSSTSKQCFP